MKSAGNGNGNDISGAQMSALLRQCYLCTAYIWNEIYVPNRIHFNMKRLFVFLHLEIDIFPQDALIYFGGQSFIALGRREYETTLFDAIRIRLRGHCISIMGRFKLKRVIAETFNLFRCNESATVLYLFCTCTFQTGILKMAIALQRT